MSDRVIGVGPVVRWAFVQQRRALVAWAIAVGAVSGLYIGFWPSMRGMDVQEMVDSLPPAMVDALGYDQIGTASGYLSSTVYGLIAPALLMVFATIKGSGLIAGDEESGVSELESTAPLSRRQFFVGRLVTLWALIGVLAAVLATLTSLLLAPLNMDVAVSHVFATATGLLALAGAVGTVALAAGAVTGRRSIAAGLGAALAVGSFMLDAIGAATSAAWMTSVSPFSWYLGEDPLERGLDVPGIAKLAILAAIAAVVAAKYYDRRDLMT